MASSARSGISLSVLYFFTFFLAVCRAQSVSSSTHIVKDPNGSNFTISINVPEGSDNDDLFFSMSGPSSHNWLAFGFGSDMVGSLIIMAYRDDAGNNLTLSPRLATGYTMPKLYDSATVEVLAGSVVTDDRFVVNGRCQSCRSWDGGSINVTNTQQSMIYALGDEGNSVRSNDASATIRQHESMGTFAMNLKAATGVAGIPSSTATGDGIGNSTDASNNDTTTVGEAAPTRGVSSPIHALLMAGSFVIGYPLGVLFLRTLNRVWMHWLMQSLTTFTVVVGAGLGIYISIKHEKHPKMNTAHQGIGLAVLALVVIQLTLGFVHHLKFKRTGSPTIMGKIHRFGGPGVILLGIVNGAIGFNFAGRRGYTVVYSLLVLIVGLGIGTILFFKRRRQTRKEAMTSISAQNFREPGIPLDAYNQYGGWPQQHEQQYQR